MKATGRTTRCMGREFSSGPMAGSMRETTSTIKNTVSGAFGGLTVGSMRGSGRTVCSTARESTKGEKVSGKRGDGKMVSVCGEACFKVNSIIFYMKVIKIKIYNLRELMNQGRTVKMRLA